jgi:hypothetical protein
MRVDISVHLVRRQPCAPSILRHAYKTFDLGTVPRVGETVCTGHGQQQVASVTWFLAESDGPAVQVHVLPICPDQYETLVELVESFRADGWTVDEK